MREPEREPNERGREDGDGESDAGDDERDAAPLLLRRRAHVLVQQRARAQVVAELALQQRGGGLQVTEEKKSKWPCRGNFVDLSSLAR